MTICTVGRSESSATVVLPAEWRRANRVGFGDVMEVVTDVQGQITFKIPRVGRDAKIDEMLDFANSLPSLPWDGSSTKADDKRILGERYA